MGFNAYPQPESAWKNDDAEWLANHRLMKAQGYRLGSPPRLVTPLMMERANAVLDARTTPSNIRMPKAIGRGH